MKALSTDWMRQATSPEARTKLEDTVRNSSFVLGQLLEIFQRWETELDRSAPDYSLPSWSHQQAHNNGKRELLERAKALVTLY